MHPIPNRMRWNPLSTLLNDCGFSSSLTDCVVGLHLNKFMLGAWPFDYFVSGRAQRI
jgi:hypothetical protein